MKHSPIFLPPKKEQTALLLVIGILTGFALAGASVSLTTSLQAPGTAAVASPFIYSFNSAGTLDEAGSMQESTSPYWWLNSGGQLLMSGDTGATIQGEAPTGSVWQALYAKDNPVDTDDGAHPQNLFRLVTKSQWKNVEAQANFMILKDNFSSSPNRNASNGLLLMSRYADAGQTLYYAGLRVDGTAVIKKKYKGTYYTMAQSQIFAGTYAGSVEDENLIPHDEWIGLRSDTKTGADGSVTVTLYMQLPGGAWKQLLSAVDTGQNFGGTPPILDAGYAGIRTDFMDVKFENYRLINI